MSDVEDSVDQGLEEARFSVPRARACEACRSRKIRCDKKTPCSNCKQLKIACRAAKPPLEKRQRVLISGRYEEQVERIYNHVQRLDATLQELLKTEKENSARRSPNTISPSLPVHSSHSSSPSPRVANLADDISHQNEPSFSITSEATSQLLEKALGNSASSQLSRETSTALNSLFDFLKTNKSTDNASFNHDMSLPSLDLTLKALRLVGHVPRQKFFLSCLGFNLDEFKAYCQKIYFPIESYSIADFVIVHAGLIWVFRNTPRAELRQFGIDQDGSDEAAQLCLSNIFSAIDQLSPFLSPNIVNITALYVAAQTALQESKPALAWNLICYASRLCLNAGIHRLKKRTNNEEDETKCRLFWSVYGLDKTMSLNFGLSPNILDDDVTIQHPIHRDDLLEGGFDTWIELDKLQSRIYMELYSGKALQQPEEVRAMRARSLGSELKNMLDRYTHLVNTVAASRDLLILDAIEMTQIFILTHLTIVYRGLPTPGYNDPLRFNEECIEVARLTLRRQSALARDFKQRVDSSLRFYIVWGLMLTPFTPFNVVLGTAITQMRREDMELLEETLKSLKDTCQESAGARRMLEICSTLYRGAKVIIEQKLNDSGAERRVDYHMHDRAGDNHGALNLAQGLMSDEDSTSGMACSRTDATSFANVNVSGHVPVAAVPLDNANDMSMLFDNYLSGNASMMDLFEGDFGLFEFQ